MLELGNQPWRTESVAGYPVRTMFQQDETFVAAYGRTAAERRASRVQLWAHTNQFVVARGVNEPVGMALSAFSLDPEDYDRWRSLEIDSFLQQKENELELDLTEIRALRRRHSRFQSLRCDQIKPTASTKEGPLLRTASQGLARLRLPNRSTIRRVWLDGRPISLSSSDGYESWHTASGFTVLQVNIPPQADVGLFQRHFVVATYEAPRTDLGSLGMRNGLA